MPMTTDHKGLPFEYLDADDPPPPRVGPDGFMNPAFTKWEWKENERRRDARDPWTAERRERRRAAQDVRGLQRFVDSLTETLARSHVELASVNARISRTPRLNIPVQKRLGAERERLERVVASQQQRVADANAQLDAARALANTLIGEGWDEPREPSDQSQEYAGVRFSYSRHRIDDSSRSRVSAGSVPLREYGRGPLR
jgi:hypothetical protein